MIGGSSELSSCFSGETESQFRIPEGVPDITFEDNPAFLVVDDDPVNIRILQNYLELKNCIVKQPPMASGHSRLLMLYSHFLFPPHSYILLLKK